MDWYEFLEHVTDAISDNSEAAAVRRELHAHLNLLTQDLLQDGLSETEASQEAIRRMGSMTDLQAAFACSYGPAKEEHMDTPLEPERTIALQHRLLRLTWRSLATVVLGIVLLWGMAGQGVLVGTVPRLTQGGSLWSVLPSWLLIAPGLILALEAEHLTPRRRRDDDGSTMVTARQSTVSGRILFGELQSAGPLLWLCIGGAAVLSGLMPFWIAGSQGVPKLLWFPATMLPPSLLLHGILSARLVARRETRDWRALAISAQSTLAFALVNALTIGVCTLVGAESTLPRLGLAADSSGLGFYFLSLCPLVLTGTLLVSSVVAEIGLPLLPDPQTWQQSTWIPGRFMQAYSQHWRLLFSGFVTGVWLGVFPISIALSNTTLGFACNWLGGALAVASLVFGLSSSAIDQVKGLPKRRIFDVFFIILGGNVIGVLAGTVTAAEQFTWATQLDFGTLLLSWFLPFIALLFTLCAVSNRMAQRWQRRKHRHTESGTGKRVAASVAP